MDSPVYTPFASQTSRTSPAQLAFAIIHLLVACHLLAFGRRTWRLTCAVSLGLAAELVTLAVAVNIMGDSGFDASYSVSSNDLALFGLITALGLTGKFIAYAVPKRFYIGWGTGYIALGGLAGLSVGFGILVLGSGENLLIGSLAGRWTLCALLAAIGVAGVLATKYRGAMLACCLIGAFLLALGIDLILNANRGTSLGLRKILDENPRHAETLRRYDPPLSTTLLVGLSWLLAVLCTIGQELAYKQRPFLPHRGEGAAFVSNKQRSWPPFKRNSSKRSRGPHNSDVEKDAPGALSPSGIPLTSAAAGAGGIGVLSRGFSSRTAHASVPESVGSSNRGSTLDDSPDSEIRALTRNYERALAALNDPNAPADDNVRPSVMTTDVPIVYRVGSMHVDRDGDGAGQDGDGASNEQLRPAAVSPAYPHPPAQYPSPRTQHRPLPVPIPEADAADQPELAAIQQQQTRQASSSPPVARTQPQPAALTVPRPPRQERDPARPSEALLAARRESDMMTTYSVPMTNITHSEYMDRDGQRPPSWTGDLPWHPDMLRGNLDPATLPAHPPASEQQEQLCLQQTQQQQQSAPDTRRPLPVPTAAVAAAAAAAGHAQAPRSRSTSQSKPPSPAWDDYEVVPRDDASPSPRPVVIGRPQSMQAYASAGSPGHRSRRALPVPVATATLPARQDTPTTTKTMTSSSARPVFRTQPTQDREPRMLLADDDLVEYDRDEQEPRGQRSRVHASQTAVDDDSENGDERESGVPGYFQYVEEDDDDEDGDRGRASTHASYSLENVQRAARKHAQRTLREEEGLGGGGARPVTLTQSDMTQPLQSVPAPSRPVLVHKDSPGVQSNVASFFSGNATVSSENASGSVSASGQRGEVTGAPGSETTVRPGREQRRSLEAQRQEQQSGSEGRVPDRRVRFRDRLLGRQTAGMK